MSCAVAPRVAHAEAPGAETALPVPRLLAVGASSAELDCVCLSEPPSPPVSRCKRGLLWVLRSWRRSGGPRAVHDVSDTNGNGPSAGPRGGIGKGKVLPVATGAREAPGISGKPQGGPRAGGPPANPSGGPAGPGPRTEERDCYDTDLEIDGEHEQECHALFNRCAYDLSPTSRRRLEIVTEFVPDVSWPGSHIPGLTPTTSPSSRASARQASAWRMQSRSPYESPRFPSRVELFEPF